MRLHDLAHDYESQTSSLHRLVLGVACSEEAIEKVGDLFCRDPHPGVGDVNEDGRRRSTLDLVEVGSFTLLTGLTGTAWVEAVSEVALPYLRPVVIGGPGARDLSFAWQRMREVGEDGAILVRPDGYIAWRSPAVRADEAATTLSRVLQRLTLVTR